ncbi:MAG: ABC transporter ATP-binding protein [Planctomycetales bacterium]|nr:ABC transporter ATP-binding protein [Planctomycetales bacterium]
MSQTVLGCNNVSHWFGTKRVLNNVNLEIAAGQILAVVGPSGCGKSTLLRAILGTHPPKAGEITANGVPVTKPNRNVGIVYQNYSLYDFLTARDNVAFGLMLDQTSLSRRVFQYFHWRQLREEQRAQATELLDKVNLGHAINLFPHEMSGGMRQRVAIAQALIMKPKILLLDEPFGALDEATREELQVMLLQLYQENIDARSVGKTPPHTILMVTHELNEALYVSDRIIGLSQYHSEGANGATVVYDKPAPVFRPNDPRDFEQFEGQKDELRTAVFDPEINQHHSDYVSFWKDHSKHAES